MKSSYMINALTYELFQGISVIHTKVNDVTVNYSFA